VLSLSPGAKERQSPVLGKIPRRFAVLRATLDRTGKVTPMKLDLHRLLTALALAAAVVALTAPVAGAMHDSRTENSVSSVVKLPGGVSVPNDWGVPASAASSGSVNAAPSVSQSNSSFDWTDAGIGAGTALAGIVLILGCAVIVRMKKVSLA
jgi:hypothetical protein